MPKPATRITEKVVWALEDVRIQEKRELTLSNTIAVLLSCKNGRFAGDKIPWIATGISIAMWTKKMAELAYPYPNQKLLFQRLNG